MKNVWKIFIAVMLVAVMFGGCGLSEEVEYPLADEVEGNTFTDAENGVSFKHPLSWESVEWGEAGTLFAVNTDYHQGLTNSSADAEAEGMLTYSVMKNDSGLNPVAYHQNAYEECMAKPVENEDFGPMCTNKGDDWEIFKVGDYFGYESDWYAIPSSGEKSKSFVVYVDDRDLFVQFGLTKTGQTDLEAANAALDMVKATLEIGTPTYNWADNALSFEIPAGYNVLEFGERLFVTTATELPDSDVSIFWTLLELYKDESVEDRVAYYSEEDSFSQGTEVIDGEEITTVVFFASFGGFEQTHYLLETDSGLLDVRAGKDEESLVVELLTSLEQK